MFLLVTHMATMVIILFLIPSLQQQAVVVGVKGQVVLLVVQAVVVATTDRLAVRVQQIKVMQVVAEELLPTKSLAAAVLVA
jgi:hypothetical protein